MYATNSIIVKDAKPFDEKKNAGIGHTISAGWVFVFEGCDDDG